MSSLTVGTINIGQFFNIPVQSQAFIDSITPQEGQIFYNTDSNYVQIYANGVWNTTNVGTGNQLYEFSSHVFKGGSRGDKEGPQFSIITAQYGGVPWVSEYLTSGTHNGYQLWTIPVTGTYTIEAGGARGGKDTNYGIADIWGATIKGDFDLVQGEKLEIVVGHGGNQYGSPHGNEAGGGGGSYVKDYTNDSPLIVAGGAGGSAGNVYGNSCSRNLTTAYGQSTIQAASTTCQGSYTATSSSVGQGGHGPDSGGSHWGGGGGGYFGDGSDGSAHCGAPTGARSFGNGSQGGTGNHCYTPSGEGNRGGFGGGGGGNLSGPGGGGGYTGGNSSGDWSSYSQHGGGAGSFNAGANQVNTRGGNSGSTGGYSGAGYVKITLKTN